MGFQDLCYSKKSKSYFCYSHDQGTIFKIGNIEGKKEEEIELMEFYNCRCIGRFGKILSICENEGCLFANVGPDVDDRCSVAILFGLDGNKALDYSEICGICDTGISQILPLSGSKMMVLGRHKGFFVYNYSLVNSDLINSIEPPLRKGERLVAAVVREQERLAVVSTSKGNGILSRILLYKNFDTENNLAYTLDMNLLEFNEIKNSHFCHLKFSYYEKNDALFLQGFQDYGEGLMMRFRVRKFRSENPNIEYLEDNLIYNTSRTLRCVEVQHSCWSIDSNGRINKVRSIQE